MSQAPHEFATAWSQSFGDTPPLGYMLRVAFPDRWTRFHALPGAKRIPEAKAEHAQVLHRANTLCTAMFPTGMPLWLTVARHAGPYDRFASGLEGYALTKALTWSDPTDPPEDRSAVTFYATRLEWQPHRLDPVFSAVASGAAQAVIFAPEAPSVLAPYDGGFDVIAATPDIARGLEQELADWMSDRPDRL